MRGGARHRRKGDRCERELVERHKALGVHAKRYPLSASIRCRGQSTQSPRYLLGYRSGVTGPPERERPRAVNNIVEATGSDTNSDYPTTARSASGGPFVSATTAPNKSFQATKLVIFTSRCEARAVLYAAREFDLHEAVDVLQAHALASGLVDEIGQDAVQAIISEPFGRVRNDLPGPRKSQGRPDFEFESSRTGAAMSSDEYKGLPASVAKLCREADVRRKVIPFSPHQRRPTPQSSVEALMLVLRERGVQALKEPKVKLWLRELNDDQIVEVGNRLQRLKPEIARAWTPDEVKDLVRNARLP
jgi:hypothetical protein